MPSTDIPISTGQPVPTSTPPEPTPSILPTDTPQENPADMEIVNLCPENRMIPFAELGIGKDDLLIMLPSEVAPQAPWVPISTGIWLLSPDETEPKYIEDLSPKDGMTNKSFQVSPDGKWLSFIQGREGDDFQTLWLASLDGKIQFEVAKVGLFTHTEWASDTGIIIFGVPNEQEWIEWGEIPPGYTYDPLERIDPFTGEKQQFTPIPDPPSTDRTHMFFFGDEEKPYDFIIESYMTEFYLRDYSLGISYPAFQWLQHKDWVDAFSTRIWLSSDGTFTLVVEHEDGIDLAFDLNYQTIMEDLDYSEIMQTIKLPEQILPFDITAAIPDTHQFLLVQRTEDFGPMVDMYELDTKNLLIKKYCIDPSSSRNWSMLSPDGHFLASNFQESTQTGVDKKWIEILNLDTGYISTIPDFWLVGWGNR